MKLSDVILEGIDFYTYESMVKVTFQEEGTGKIADLLRALPGVTTVTSASAMGPDMETFKIKLISQKTGEEAFESFKNNALSKYSVITDVDVAENTLEKI